MVKLPAAAGLKAAIMSVKSSLGQVKFPAVGVGGCLGPIFRPPQRLQESPSVNV